MELPDRSLPLLAPMSEVAGRLAPQVGRARPDARVRRAAAPCMGGVSGVYAAKVVVLGAGVAGMNAATIALGMQAEVLLLDLNIARLRAGRRDLPRPHADDRVQPLRGGARRASTPTW